MQGVILLYLVHCCESYMMLLLMNAAATSATFLSAILNSGLHDTRWSRIDFVGNVNELAKVFRLLVGIPLACFMNSSFPFSFKNAKQKKITV